MELLESLAEACGDALLRLGPEALGQVLAIVTDVRIQMAARTEAAWAGWQLAFRAEPPRREEAVPVYRAALRQALEADAPVELVTRLVEGLVNLRDLESWPLIGEAYKAEKADEGLIGRHSARSRIKSSRRPAIPSLDDWLYTYRLRLNMEKKVERLIREEPAVRALVRKLFPDIEQILGIEQADEEESGEAPARLTLNDKDKCWCGSGRPYRSCHKQPDEWGETAPPLEGATPPATLTTYTFKVQPTGFKRVWRVLELAEHSTLHALHEEIQSAFEWDDDHLYSFYMRNKLYDNANEYTGAPSEALVDSLDLDAPQATDVRLDELELSRGHKFKYLFDFGDSNVFQITVTAVNRNAPAGDYPRLVEEHGTAPGQYPDWEDEEDDRRGEVSSPQE